MAVATVALVVLMLGVVPAKVFGATHTVGDSSGWNQGVDYTTWASKQTFSAGDSLVFNYGSSHSVDQVSKDDYDNCNTGNAINSYSGGSTTIQLSSSGAMYFICPSLGHCSGGMKLAITVGSSSTAPATGSPSSTLSPPSSSGSSGSTPSTSSGAVPTPHNGAESVLKLSNMMLGLSFALGTVLALVC